MSDDNAREYKGLGETAAALGQSQVDGYVGSAIGAAAGAAVGGIAHNQKTYDAVKLAQDTVEKARAQAIAAQNGEIWKLPKSGRVSEEALETAENVLKEKGTAGKLWHGASRSGKLLIGAVAGAVAIGTVGNLVGMVRGQKKAQQGREQFDELVAENRALKHQLELAETHHGRSKSFTAAVESERSQSAERLTER
ncbi:MAG: hypothetical protein AB7L92_07425 [Alphaproteobacteria bacterium]